MSYTDQKITLCLTPTAISVTATGESHSFEPPFHPYIVRGAAFVPTVTGGDYTSLNWSLNIVDLVSGSTASAICTVTGVASDAVGDVIYKKNLDTEVSPGQKIYFHVDTAVTSDDGGGKFYVYLEPRWEQPANDADVRVIT
jgi:hypothetical protein